MVFRSSSTDTGAGACVSNRTSSAGTATPRNCTRLFCPTPLWVRAVFPDVSGRSVAIPLPSREPEHKVWVSSKMPGMKFGTYRIRQRAEFINQRHNPPDLVIGEKIAPRWHRGISYSVLHDPEYLGV